MISGLETADELLALWADLLRQRSGLVEAPALQISVQYPSERRDATYRSTLEQPNVAAGVRKLIMQDINDQIATVEHALERFGVRVTRET